ncbi:MULTISPECIES: ABC transporter substrate-binding protein [unclassified Enterococcus]|uniref:ABC transporter substrate-binding protein n=1 Tax=unclassified Enterococcus TaxID=2608891 RepID=UPI0015540C4D|nr:MULTISPECIES: ABC transporter substrate-binding protein [unclassified Enterococcus]MBS7576745.1 ABC transporter substrate-binding protein [Enterococcus sp. MMGLQ5-2]MBS7583768.1 ABC transporter substrate-binding protein [Enterococcus sp. MMGLQ5-1]NPD11629.1 ABC transporter substrate-binding protein [Enterococcus sp. MMGLQ5-1]NPD36582.1 ABC transporter substrate-binding protein [Enterococcus sp. MMGLQ5-2]
MKKVLYLVASLIAILFLASCSSNNQTEDKGGDSTDGKTTYPLTIENYTRAESGSKWTKKDQTFDSAPKSVVANVRPMAELLLHLGLQDSISGVGGVFGEADESVADQFSKLKNLGDSYISQEVTLSANPDLVFGRSGLFDNAEWGTGTVDSLNEMGINTYVMATSVNGGTFDSIYDDLDNLGKIFNVQEKASSFASEIKARQDKLEDSLSGIKTQKTFAYIHSNDPENISVYSLKDESFTLSLFKMLKMKHVFNDVDETELNVEALIEADPDILIIPTWDETDGAQKMVEGLLSSSKVSSLKAVKNKAIYIMDYNYLFGYSYQSLDGVEQLAKAIYPDLVEE